MPRVFISYSHDNEEHITRVQRLVERLRTDSVTVVIDRDMLPGGPPEGWPRWSERQVREADLVLVACTAIYRQRYEGDQPPGAGLGAISEAAAIRHFLYEHDRFNEKVRVIIFDPSDRPHIPVQLSRYYAFQLFKDESYAELLAWVRGPALVETPLLPQPPAIRWPSPAPGYRSQIADRKDEIGLFEKMVAGQSHQRILLLRGSSGTGKTFLLTELFAYARQLKLPAAALDFKGCPSLDEVFEALRLDLGKQILPHSYGASGTARFYQLISDLQQLATPVVLVFDTYEQASPDANVWIENQLLPRLNKAPAVVVVIGGQQLPNYDKHPWRDLVQFRELQPIQRVEDWLEYSERKWQNTQVKADHVKALTLATGGNPGQVSALLETMVRMLQADDND